MNPKLTCCLAALCLAACRPATPPPSVVPGLAVRMRAVAGVDTIVYRRSVRRGDTDSIAGTRTVVLRQAGGPNGARLLNVEQRFPGGGGTIVDTALAEWPGLRAVAHQSHQPARTMRFTFAADAADGVVTSAAPADSLPRGETVHQELGGPIFDSNIIELVVASLPLRSGLDVELPFFIYERGGRVPMAVTVRDRVTADFAVGAREAWVVSVAVPGAPATVWVDTRTRIVLRVRYDIAARNYSFTDERITPLPR